MPDMNKKTILVVDDDHEIVRAITITLEREGYHVLNAYDGLQALDCVTSREVHLIIIDVMMPKLDGLSAVMKIREKKNLPIIILSAKGEDSDKILGLSMGADDYISKPFNPMELVARVKSQLRRYKKYNLSALEEENPVLQCSDLVLDTKKHECLVDDVPVSLTPTEFSILQILLEAKGNVVSGEELFHRIWKDEYYIKSNNTITVHIRRLREKLNDTLENPKYIKTIWGVGYKIDEK